MVVQLSCEVLPTQARLPKVRFLLTGIGNKPMSQRVSSSKGATNTPQGQQLSQGQTNKSKGVVGNNDPNGNETSRQPVGGSLAVEASRARDRGLYGVLQSARNIALKASVDATPTVAAVGGEQRENPKYRSSDGAMHKGFVRSASHVAQTAALDQNPGSGERTPRHDETTASATTTKTTTTAADDQKPSGRKQRNKTSNPSSAAQQLRSEIGNGRALFGGFVPLRRAPAASLYDFGGLSSPDVGIGGGGTATGVGGTGSGATSVASLDEARIKKYAQEATARAHRLGAEKRNARISKSKRQG